VTTPATQNITIKRGDSFDLFFRVKGRNAQGDLIYLDLTGVDPAAQIRSSDGVLLVAFTCTLANQSTLPGGVLLRLEDTDTGPLEAPLTNGKWDVELKWPGVNGDRKTVLEGNVTVTEDYTHA
jgi:hypothetical protein